MLLAVGVNMAAKPSSTKKSTKEAGSDLAVSYNEFKEHEGQRYTGMKIGRSHKPQVQDRPQAGGQREMERYSADPTQPHDHVLAKRCRRSRETGRTQARIGRRAGRARRTKAAQGPRAAPDREACNGPAALRGSRRSAASCPARHSRAPWTAIEIESCGMTRSWTGEPAA
jgi:hypothetical protein